MLHVINCPVKLKVNTENILIQDTQIDLSQLNYGFYINCLLRLIVDC